MLLWIHLLHARTRSDPTHLPIGTLRHCGLERGLLLAVAPSSSSACEAQEIRISVCRQNERSPQAVFRVASDPGDKNDTDRPSIGTGFLAGGHDSYPYLSVAGRIYAVVTGGRTLSLVRQSIAVSRCRRALHPVPSVEQRHPPRHPQRLSYGLQILAGGRLWQAQDTRRVRCFVAA